MKYLLSINFFLFSFISFGQGTITKSLKDFGARGDGITNDMPAFIKATKFFNERKGNGTLLIPSGTYMVHTQSVNPIKGSTYYRKIQCFEFVDCQNLKILGEGKAIIKYIDGQRFGSFHPQTGAVFHPKMPFTDSHYRIAIGEVFDLLNCRNIEIKNIEGDGNIANMLIGGTWGDVGYQVGHCGIVLTNTHNIEIDGVSFHHFGLDGIMVVNKDRIIAGIQLNDNVVIKNSSFEYNGRQGLSWVGGIGLEIHDSKFNHTGRNGRIFSPPGAGMDIESEVAALRNGKFVKCEFINNSGVGVIAASGPSQDMEFDNCTFWGTSAWSIWTPKPNFIFKNSKIYGSIVHVNAGKTDYEATKFINCHFENKRHNGKKAYGEFLMELNNIQRTRFEKCTFIAKEGVIPIWIDSPETDPEGTNLFKDCTINLQVDTTQIYHYPSMLRNVTFEDTKFNISQDKQEALKKMDFTPVKSVKYKTKKSKIQFADKTEF
jgi:hypothetical protein